MGKRERRAAKKARRRGGVTASMVVLDEASAMPEVLFVVCDGCRRIQPYHRGPCRCGHLYCRTASG